MEVHAQQNALDMTRAEYLTVAAISHGVAILKDQPNWSGKMTNIRFSQSSSDTYSLVVQRSGQDITIQGSADVEGITEQKTVTMSTDDFEADEKEPEKKDEPTSNVTRFNSDWWRNWVQRLRAAQQRSL